LHNDYSVFINGNNLKDAYYQITNVIQKKVIEKYIDDIKNSVKMYALPDKNSKGNSK
jgi:hypothetical protein